MTDIPSTGRLARTTFQIGVVTGAARALGFGRWIVFGLTVGSTFLGNTYQTANWVPNVLYEMVAGGVLAAVFVPTFVAQLDDAQSDSDELASTIFNLFSLIALPLVVVGVVFGPQVMELFTSAVTDPDVRRREIEVGAYLLAFFLPQTFLYIGGMVMRGLLHAGNRFLWPAAAPAFQSAILITTYLAYRQLGAGDLEGVDQRQLLVLALGTTAAVVAWAGCQLPQLWRLGHRWRPVLRMRNAAVRGALRAGGGGFAFYLVSQIGFVLTLVLANRFEGGVVAFLIALAFYELPNAVAGYPVATSSFPTLSRHAGRGDDEAFGALLSNGLRSQLVFLAPAAALLVVLGERLTGVVFALAPEQARPELVGATLSAMAAGLPAYAMLQLLVRACYARRSTVAPVVGNIACVALFAAMAVPLALAATTSGSDGMAAIGAAHAAGQWIGVAVVAVALRRLTPAWRSRGDAAFGATILLRSAAAAAVAWLTAGVMTADWASLIVGGVAGGLVYLVSVARTPVLRQTIEALRHRS